MSRLPHALQPVWPAVKRLHRAGTRGMGAVTRRVPAGGRGVPRRGIARSADTARAEPGSVRIHGDPTPERLCRPLPGGTPAGHWVFGSVADVEVSGRYTLEVADGTLLGDYAATITPGGLLDFETSSYFGVTGWQEHPLYLRRRLPEPVRLDGSLLSLATRGSAANYYHFLLDVLPRWGIFTDTMPGVRPDAIYVNTATGYQRELLGMLGLPDVRLIEPDRHAALRAERLLVPSTPNSHLMTPPALTAWLRERLPAGDTGDRPRRVYVTRGARRNTRRVVNEAEVVALLEKRGFTVIDPGRHSVQEQIDFFAAAEVVVAPHGAALANLAFCHAGVRVLELFEPRYVNPCYWTIASGIPDARYRYLVCGDDRRPAGSPMQGVLRDITVPLAPLRAELDALLS
jgi:capsular polysaccharide biosynthesis protein